MVVLWQCWWRLTPAVCVCACVGVECFTSRWWSFFPIGFAAVLVYVVGVPVSFLVMLYRKRASLDDARVRLRYGTLYTHLVEKYYFYEVLLLVKRVGVIVVATFLGSFLAWQFGILATLYALAMWLQNRWRPYCFAMHNDLEQFLNGCVACVIVCALILENSKRSRSSGVVLVVLLFGVFGAALVRTAMVFWHELQRVRKAKAGTLEAPGASAAPSLVTAGEITLSMDEHGDGVELDAVRAGNPVFTAPAKGGDAWLEGNDSGSSL